MRPRTLDEVLGQEHLLGPGRILQRLIRHDRIPSMILWGPPGVGKTTLARVIAHTTRSAFDPLSATSSGVKDLREAVEKARRRRSDEGRGTVLFIDEIHRFNKGQQDALLPHVEAGVCRLIGATTENPSFEVNSALLSRARVFRMQPLSNESLVSLIQRALADQDRGLGRMRLSVSAEVIQAIVHSADGDARRALNLLETAVDLLPPDMDRLDESVVREALGTKQLRHDKAAESHYNVASALIKSMRASDPDAAVYWLVRLLEAGDDPMFVARRLVVFAAEDIGNADPRALLVASAAAQAAHLVGLPEARLPLTQATVYLALTAKSNTALTAYERALADVQAHGSLEVPEVLRNAVTGLMRAEGYGKGYVYPHDCPEGVEPASSGCLPDALHGRRYVTTSPRGWEARAWEALEERRRKARGED